MTGLEHDVETLSSEVAALSAAVSDYNLGTTNLAIFEGVVEKVPFGQHYVYWRDSEYRYCLAVGPLTVSGTTFSSADPVTVYSDIILLVIHIIHGVCLLMFLFRLHAALVSCILISAVILLFLEGR